MTYFLNFRSAGVGGAVIDPYLLEGDGTTDPPSLSVVPWAQVPAVFAGRNILFATHGFNVNYAEGAKALGRLGDYLDLPSPNLFIGILWPGDAWIPVVDYPFEGDVAIDCGQRLAQFCNSMGGAARRASLSRRTASARASCCRRSWRSTAASIRLARGRCDQLRLLHRRICRRPGQGRRPCRCWPRMRTTC